MDNFPIFNNDIKVSEDVPNLYFFAISNQVHRPVRTRNSNSTQVNFFQKSNFATDSIFEKSRTMDSNKSKKVEHDLVNDDIELKHEEKDSNDAESIVENHNSGFLRRPQKFDKV